MRRSSVRSRPAPPSSFHRSCSLNLFHLDGLFLNSFEPAVASPSYQPHLSTPATADTPESFKTRRIALRLSTAQLGALLGIGARDVQTIESVALGEEVSFLHNLTLSLLELGGLDSALPA